MSLTQQQVNFGLNIGATHHDGNEYRLKSNGRWGVINPLTRKFSFKALGKGKLENLEDYLHRYNDELDKYLDENNVDRTKIDVQELSAIWVNCIELGKKYLSNKLKGV